MKRGVVGGCLAILRKAFMALTGHVDVWGGCHRQSRGDPEWISLGCLNHNSEVARLHGYVTKEHIMRSAERAGCGGTELTPPQETMETQGESRPGGQPVQGVKGLVSENLWPQRCQQG